MLHNMFVAAAFESACDDSAVGHTRMRLLRNSVYTALGLHPLLQWRLRCGLRLWCKHVLHLGVQLPVALSRASQCVQCLLSSPVRRSRIPYVLCTTGWQSHLTGTQAWEGPSACTGLQLLMQGPCKPSCKYYEIRVIEVHTWWRLL